MEGRFPDLCLTLASTSSTTPRLWLASNKAHPLPLALLCSCLISPTGPFFYLPKLEHHLEARLWNDIFNFSQDRVGLSRGSIKATVLIETILAAFQMDEVCPILSCYLAFGN